jgi:hypothetical protein
MMPRGEAPARPSPLLDGGHRLDAFDISAFQFIDEGEHGAKLPRIDRRGDLGTRSAPILPKGFT